MAIFINEYLSSSSGIIVWLSFLFLHFWIVLVFCGVLQDDELDISPVEIDDALVIEDDDLSDDDEDDREDVCS